MPGEITWDAVEQREFETGVDHGVLYLPSETGEYDNGVAWNGLTSITESPSGAEPSPQYADNIKYLNLSSAEEFGATLEAFMYPDEFGPFDGLAEPVPGVYIGQQSRGYFGLSYRTLVGNATKGTDFGYKIHLVYGCTTAPSEKSYATVNDSPEATSFSWELTTTPVQVGTIAGKKYKPTASLVINSTKVNAEKLELVEAALYGTSTVDPSLPLPKDVIAMFAAA